MKWISTELTSPHLTENGPFKARDRKTGVPLTNTVRQVTSRIRRNIGSASTDCYHCLGNLSEPAKKNLRNGPVGGAIEVDESEPSSETRLLVASVRCDTLVTCHHVFHLSCLRERMPRNANWRFVTEADDAGPDAAELRSRVTVELSS